MESIRYRDLGLCPLDCQCRNRLTVPLKKVWLQVIDFHRDKVAKADVPSQQLRLGKWMSLFWKLYPLVLR